MFLPYFVYFKLFSVSDILKSGFIQMTCAEVSMEILFTKKTRSTHKGELKKRNTTTTLTGFLKRGNIYFTQDGNPMRFISAT